jgi:hypothetical protein
MVDASGLCLVWETLLALLLMLVIVLIVDPRFIAAPCGLDAVIGSARANLLRRDVKSRKLR